MNCYLCGAAAVVTCNSPDRRIVPVRIETLAVGVHVYSFNDPEGKNPFVIERIKPMSNGHEVDVRRLKAKSFQKYFVRTDRLVNAYADAPCGLQCCEFHHAERDERNFRCVNHWRIPEDLAA